MGMKPSKKEGQWLRRKKTDRRRDRKSFDIMEPTLTKISTILK